MVTRRWNESDEGKASYVRDLFTALAKRYNAMTDVWTLGLHRLWKRQAMQLLALRLGRAVAWHRDAHHYTADSIRTWLSRDELSKAMVEAGFVDARYTLLSTGFGTVHFRSRAAG